MNRSEKTLWLPDLVYAGNRFQSGLALVCDPNAKIEGLAPNNELQEPVRLKNRAMLPGLVNAHSHAFQRVIRGRTEYRTRNERDSFWTWREMMYRAATGLTPEDIYDASRMAFLEMALSGITAVGEFHYIHNQPDGTLYDDPNLLAKEVVRAARDVGLRIALLRVAYARSGFQTEPNTQQARFIETDPDVYLDHLTRLRKDLAGLKGQAWVGVAPHSVRAAPLNYLKEVVRFGNEQGLPIHMHVAEQPAEVSACIEEYGRSPVALLETEGLLSERFTGVHMIHITPKAARMIANARATVCACPTTERNLGDGIVPIDKLFQEGVRVSLGTDSQIQIDLLEDARELEYHLRLQKIERVVLVGRVGEGRSELASQLFECATINGAQSIGAPNSGLEPGLSADFFTVDLSDPSIAGASQDDLLSSIVFSLSKTAVRDVVVGNERIVENGRHTDQDIPFHRVQMRKSFRS
ncbi:MAG: formimidoylglutamate deiminase [Acidobacteria bacterium]|nr:formimidoylglutamate deiminase [Acidobacteriota bacterium]